MQHTLVADADGSWFVRINARNDKNFIRNRILDFAQS